MSEPLVLVVDDSDVTRTVVARTLKRGGFAIIEARDGLEGALLALREQPAAVVTDLEMPGMDGYQLVRLLKGDPASAHIPVIVVTSHGEAPSRYWGLRTGADAFLTKGHEASDRDASPPPSLAGLYLMPLPVRDATGVLALLPRDAAQFAALSRPLIEHLASHLGLVLDNARLSQRLRELSMLDGLTRVLNHRAIHDRLAEELLRARRYGHPLSVVLCDLDHFKLVNDAHGHLAGDTVLLAGAQALRRCLRTADAFGRYGGEEFLAVLPESDLESGRRAAERLRRALADQPVALPSGQRVAVTGSFGVAARSELPELATASALIALSDSRLYEAKSAGRNRVVP